MMRALQNIRQDILHAARGLGKNPGFAVTAMLILALAIGGNTTMFIVIRAVLLKPLEYRDPDRLVQFSGGATPAWFEEMSAGARSFSGIGAFTGQENLSLAGGEEPEIVRSVRASAGFLRILGTDPILGRDFSAADDSPGGVSVVMISADLWQRRFHGDPRIVGKTAILGTTPYTIIGVLPRGFQFPFSGVDAWMPRPSEWPLIPPKSRSLSPFLTVFGRLGPGVNLDQANAELAVVHHQYSTAHPSMLDAKPTAIPRVSPLKDRLVASIRLTLWLLFGAVSFVLLIACGNLASLLLVRSNGRGREFGIRSALGATRSRLIGQLLAESVVLSCLGGTLGVLVAAWSLQAIPTMTAINVPRASEIHVDWLVLGFAGALSIGTGMLFGLAPALAASNPDLMGVLRGSGEANGQGIPKRFAAWFSARGILVSGQVALSVVLLTGAALLMQSVIRLRQADTGFNPANLLTTRISLPPARYDTDLKKATFFRELVQRVEASPGIQSAAAAMFLPMTGFVGSPVQDASKAPLKLNERPIATALIVTPDYFRTLKIPVRRGRDFGDRDTGSSQPVAIVDEALARRLWPGYPNGENPIGGSLLVGGVNPQPREIVGIVARVHQNLDDSAWPGSVYMPFSQSPQPSAMLAVRTQGDPLLFAGTLREQVRSLDRDQPISPVRTMDDLVDAEVGQRRLLMNLLALFAGVALLLAVIGIYGVISYSVTQRIQELGIRRALGAGPADILKLVVGQGLGLTFAGIATGMGGALALTRVAKSLLFQVSPADPATFAGVGILFILVAAAATYIPARRAIRIDPMAALRI